MGKKVETGGMRDWGVSGLVSADVLEAAGEGGEGGGDGE